jgi:hypothetical protein
MRGGKLRFLRFGGRKFIFYFKPQTAEHLNTLIISAIALFLLGFISPFAVLCYFITRAKIE